MDKITLIYKLRKYTIEYLYISPFDFIPLQQLWFSEINDHTYNSKS